jgi:hypothetical protein
MHPMVSDKNQDMPPQRHSSFTYKRLTWSTIQKALVLGLVICAIGLPRYLGQGSYVTIDENSWLYRSANFLQALSKADFANTFQMGHPGVTVTWVGAVSFLITYPAYIEEAPGQVSKPLIFLNFLKQTGREPLQLLQASRKVAVLANIFVLVLAYLSTITLVGL